MANHWFSQKSAIHHAQEIHSDISPKDLLRALVGMCHMQDQPGWQARVLRLVDIFVDDLRLPAKIRKANQSGAAKRPRTKRGLPTIRT